MKGQRILIPLVFVGVPASAALETQKPAAEIKKPVTQWTCEEFTALDDQYTPDAIYWATAYAKGGTPQASVLDIAGTEPLTPMTIDDCDKELKAPFWQKPKAAWEKVEGAAKRM